MHHTVYITKRQVTIKPQKTKWHFISWNLKRHSDNLQETNTQDRHTVTRAHMYGMFSKV